MRAANPNSAEAARDVAVSLNKLADLLARRGQPGDAEQAWGHYQRSLEVREQLRAANPNSAEAARDLMVSLERMAQMTSQREDAEGKQEALQFQLRALEIAVKLREANRQSVFFGRTAAVSFYLAAQHAHAAGEQELAGQCLGGCHQVLHELITAGCTLDAPMVQLYQNLNKMAGGPPSGGNAKA